MRRPRARTLTAGRRPVLAVAAALAPTRSATAGSLLGDPKNAAGTSNDATYTGANVPATLTAKDAG